jgi:plasminogen activator
MRLAIAVLCLSLPAAASAQQVETTAPLRFSLAGRLSVDTYLGYLSANGQETVYSQNGAKESQLNWDLTDAMVVGTDLRFAATDRVNLRTGGWIALTGVSNSYMRDTDWLHRAQGIDEWSERSWHPNTDLDRAFQFDIGADVRVARWREADFRAIGGYRVLNYEWTAKDGHGIYTGHALRDTEVTLSGNVIGYQQWWRTPYLGLGVDYAAGKTRITGEVIGSLWVDVNDRDLHYLRNLYFTEDFDRTGMVGVSLKAERDLAPGWTLSGGIDYQKYWEADGTITQADLGTGEVARGSDSSGVSNETFLLTLGLVTRF